MLIVPEFDKLVTYLKTTNGESLTPYFMQPYKWSIILSTVLIISITLLFLSSHPEKQNYELYGKVNNLGGSSVSMDIYITQDLVFPDDFEGLHKVNTSKDGSFETEYRAEINAPIYFYVYENGMKPLRYRYIPKSKFGAVQKITRTFIYTPISNDNPEKSQAEESNDFFYRSECASHPPKSVKLDDILFIDNVRQVECPEFNGAAFEGDIRTKSYILQKSLFSTVSTDFVSERKD